MLRPGPRLASLAAAGWVHCAVCCQGRCTQNYWNEHSYFRQGSLEQQQDRNCKSTLGRTRVVADQARHHPRNPRVTIASVIRPASVFATPTKQQPRLAYDEQTQSWVGSAPTLVSHHRQ